MHPASGPYALRLLPERLAIVRLEGAAPVPQWAQSAGGFVSITRTRDELSIVVDEGAVPDDLPALRGYRALRVEGTLDPALVGVLVSIASPLADAGVPIFAISTHDTDYVLVRHAALDRAVRTLEGAGHRVGRDER
jgi:uncharacterized protein